MERQLVVRSHRVAQAAEKSLLTRLEKARAALFELGKPRRGKKRLTSLYDWENAANTIIESYQVKGLLQLEYQVTERKSCKRAYGNRPARIIKESSIYLEVKVDEEALSKKKKMFGWRVYVTNEPNLKLSFADAVVAYREEYLIERGFERFKGHPLSLAPMYLQRDDHISGLIRLLSIGLRMLTLVEFYVRRNLKSRSDQLQGLYPGNPKRSTIKPTAEKLLSAFKDISLVVIKVKNKIHAHITSLSSLHERILALLDFPGSIYANIVTEFANSTSVCLASPRSLMTIICSS